MFGNCLLGDSWKVCSIRSFNNFEVSFERKCNRQSSSWESNWILTRNFSIPEENAVGLKINGVNKDFLNVTLFVCELENK